MHHQKAYSALPVSTIDYPTASKCSTTSFREIIDISDHTFVMETHYFFWKHHLDKMDRVCQHAAKGLHQYQWECHKSVMDNTFANMY